MEKSYEVRISSQALAQIAEIRDYVQFVLLVPESAQQLLRAFHQSLETLRQFPERIPLVREELWRAAGIRRMRVGNYFLYFWIDEPNRTVTVTAVVYGRRDQAQALLDMEIE